MKRIEFAPDKFSVLVSFVMQVLVAGTSLDRGHGAHPKVIRVGAYNSEGAFKRDFDFETNAVESDDVDGRKGEVGAHQETLTACGMMDGNKSNDESKRLPDEIQRAVKECDTCFAINRTFGSDHF